MTPITLTGVSGTMLAKFNARFSGKTVSTLQIDLSAVSMNRRFRAIICNILIEVIGYE